MQYHPHNTDYEGHGSNSNYSMLENEANNLYDSQQKYMHNRKDDDPLGSDYHRIDEEEKPDEDIEKNIFEEEEKARTYNKSSPEVQNEENPNGKSYEGHATQTTDSGFNSIQKPMSIEDAIRSAINQEKGSPP